MKSTNVQAGKLNAKSADELSTELMSLLKAQFVLRMQNATNQLAKSSEIKKVRREIARVRTILTEKAVLK